MHGRKATADSLLWHPSTLMRKDRIFLWFLCHWWVFLPSFSMKIYVITEINSQVISLSAKDKNIANCWHKVGTERAEDSTFHLSVGKWRAWRSAWSAHAALVPLNAFLIPAGGRCPELSRTPQVLFQIPPLLTELSSLIYHPIHLTSCWLSMLSFFSSPHRFLLFMPSLALVFFFLLYLKNIIEV